MSGKCPCFSNSTHELSALYSKAEAESESDWQISKPAENDVWLFLLKQLNFLNHSNLSLKLPMLDCEANCGLHRTLSLVFPSLGFLEIARRADLSLWGRAGSWTLCHHYRKIVAELFTGFSLTYIFTFKQRRWRHCETPVRRAACSKLVGRTDAAVLLFSSFHNRISILTITYVDFFTMQS